MTGPVLAAVAAAVAVAAAARPRRGRRHFASDAVTAHRSTTHRSSPAVSTPPSRKSGHPANRVIDELPEAVDLLLGAAAAGLTVSEAVPLARRWGPPALEPGWHDVHRRLTMGEPAATAVTALRTRWGEPAAGVVATLVGHLADGAPLLDPLQRAADEARRRRRRAAELRAQRLPVLLLFPLVTCILPAFGLLTVAPVVIDALRTLELPSIDAVAPALEATASAFRSTEYTS